jgi:hypothetical protein
LVIELLVHEEVLASQPVAARTAALVSLDGSIDETWVSLAATQLIFTKFTSDNHHHIVAIGRCAWIVRSVMSGPRQFDPEILDLRTKLPATNWCTSQLAVSS